MIVFTWVSSVGKWSKTLLVGLYLQGCLVLWWAKALKVCLCLWGKMAIYVVCRFEVSPSIVMDSVVRKQRTRFWSITIGNEHETSGQEENWSYCLIRGSWNNCKEGRFHYWNGDKSFVWKLDDGNHIVEVQDCDKGRVWWPVECGAQIFLKVNHKSIQDIELVYQCSFTMSLFLFLKAYVFLLIVTSFSFVH